MPALHKKALRCDALPIAALAACALILHRDGLFGGPAFYELDTRLFYFPLAQWVGEHLHGGVFPLWLPEIFTGYPIFADGELGLAYLPQVLLLWALPTPIAMVWLRVLHVFLAGVFTYLFLKTLRLDSLPALGGALVFAFGSFLTAQMHHENVVRSAVWLPAVLVCLERSLFRSASSVIRLPRAALFWTASGALAFSQSALGLHVQPVLMLLLAVGLFALFRAFVATRNAEPQTRNAFVPLVSAAALVLGGLAVAAIQWAPLGEWALVSSRRGGVDYEFASAFGIAPVGLVTLIFPYFFRLPDATTWWSLWQQWEIELYVGIPTLALMLVGLIFARRTELLYFVVLGGLSLWIAMAHDAPLLNLHFYLWSLPGFSFLRAPGRFTYLLVFACACVAAFGLQALNQRRVRVSVALIGALPAVGLLAALLALLPNWHGFLLGDTDRALAYVSDTYLSTRAQYPIDPGLVLSGFTTSFDLTTPKTAWSLVLLALTALAFVAWLALGYQRRLLGQGLFVGLLAVDLLVFASDFHPRTPLASLVPELPTGVTPGTRVFLHDAMDLPTLEPDQLVAAGVATAQGYSSLPSQRHVELESATRDDPRLIDLWSAPLVIAPARPPDLRQAGGVDFQAQHPLAAGFGGAAPDVFRLPVNTTALRLIGTLSYAYNIPQGSTVAQVSVDGRTVPLRAGVDFSERAYDRPSLRGLLQHDRARVAYDFEEATPEGEDYTAHLYTTDVSLPASGSRLTITPTDPRVLVQLYGIGAIDASGTVRSLGLGDRDGLQTVPRQPDSTPVVVSDANALPRAFVVPRAQTFSPARHPGLTATQLVAEPDVDLHRMTLIENDPETPTEPAPGPPVVAASSFAELSPNHVLVRATVDQPSYLVLDDFYQRGWSARVDGQPARVFIANALFRAVPLGPGAHTVDFRFEPQSILAGAALSLLALLVALLAMGAAVVRRAGPPATLPPT